MTPENISNTRGRVKSDAPAYVDNRLQTVRWDGGFLNARLVVNRTRGGGDHDDLRLTLTSPMLGAVTVAHRSETGVTIEVIGQCERAELAEMFRALADQLETDDPPARLH